MQLYILDTRPRRAARAIPSKYKFKMLIELGQLICSAGISDAYKSISQGKELQKFILENQDWVYQYYSYLLKWAYDNINMKEETISNLNKIQEDFVMAIIFEEVVVPTHAYFRYAQSYQCSIPSKTLLPIDECIKQYKKYLQWKMKG